jgi:DNA-binding response OmpR family regulator
MQILVVDGHPEIAQMLVKKISQTGCLVEMVGSCRAAISKLALNRYDWLVLDYVLPDGSGLDLIRIIQMPSSGKILFAYEADKPEVKQTAVELGVNTFFKKPDEALKLVDFISQQRETAGKRERLAGELSK